MCVCFVDNAGENWFPKNKNLTLPQYLLCVEKRLLEKVVFGRRGLKCEHRYIKEKVKLIVQISANASDMQTLPIYPPSTTNQMR